MTEKEYICRSMWAAQDCKVQKFWLDEEGFGCCEVLMLDGKTVKTFTQNPKTADPDAVASYHKAS